MSIAEEEIERYCPSPLDAKVAEAVLAGQCSAAEIAAATQLPVEQVYSVLRDTVAAGWIARMVTGSIRHRMGFVIAALFGRACTGDVAAARLLFERFGSLAQVSHVVHHTGIDARKLSDADLTAVIKQNLLSAGPVLEAEFYEQGGEGGDAGRPSGAGAAEEGGADALLAAIPEAGSVPPELPAAGQEDRGGARCEQGGEDDAGGQPGAGV